MPITSERLSLIVEEALAIARAASALHEICVAVVKMEAEPGTALAVLQSYLLVNPLPHPLHLLLEQRHAQVNAKGNRRKRMKAAAKRREQGVPERPQVAPLSLADLGLSDPIEDEFNKWNRGE